MGETKQQVTQRKIRNGLRKQAEVIQRKKEQIWNILKYGEDKRAEQGLSTYTVSTNSKYRYVPLFKRSSIISGDITA